MADQLVVIYWDSSALLSYLFKDDYSELMKDKARQKGIHLLTALAAAEVYTEISRIQREELLPAAVIEYLHEMLERGPWSKLNIVPDCTSLRELALRWPLKGSGLWHLAAAKTLHREFPELMILTIDRELAQASRGEKIRLCIALSA